MVISKPALSKTQLELLRSMRRGTLIHIRFQGGYEVQQGIYDHVTIRSNTVEALEKRGLIEKWNLTYYRITEAGKVAAFEL